jgi:two-component system CheB/CheR fusion protein
MQKKSSAQPERQVKASQFPVVGIGGSAGGIEAALLVFQHLPADTGMAFVLVQHIPDHPGKIAEIMGRATAMPVQEATHELPLLPNHVYLIPPNKEMSMAEGTLRLEERPQQNRHMSIDHFFYSLAEAQAELAIGVLLSGSSTDGTLGLRAIKNAGGTTFAQDGSAQFQSMPQSAINESVVDLVLSPEAIARELARLAHRTELIIQSTQDAGEGMIADNDEDLQQVIQLLKKSNGVDFTHYKMKTIKRRIIRRMLVHQLESLKDYLDYLKQHTGEIYSLYQDLLINVTAFFRDPDTMEYLKKTLIPRVIKSKPAHDPIRVWVPACSSGEEAYSLAMLFMEVLGDRVANTPVQIFATDLSDVTIAKARLGLYNQNDIVNISPKRLQRFFTKMDGSYRIIKTIRDMCVFAPHNIFRDPPFSRIDIISCCNLMIYLDTVLQKKILATFHYALNPEGFLVLGKSETIGAATQLFGQVEKKYKVYLRKKEAATRAIFEMNYRLPEVEHSTNYGTRAPAQKPHNSSADLEKAVDSILLDRYIPATVVVNQDLEILQFRGSTGLYLEPSPGKASLNLLKMARPGLVFELRNAIHKVSKTGQAIKKSGLEIKNNGRGHLVSIEVTPLRSDTEDRLFLVVFQQVAVTEAVEIKKSFSKDKVVKQLEDELRVVREDIRSIIEEQEASNEELQSANEEIVSSNEELQSINEELETSKEELESTNEELMTINAELQMRNEQLAEAYEYAEAVFGTIREAVLVLDKDLRVKSSNTSFYRIFKMTEEETEGLLIYELSNRQWDIPELHHLFENLLERNDQHNGLEITHNFPLVGEKVLLVNACRVTQRIPQQQLILLAMEDITELKKSN